MKIMIAAGGTGGHIYPALALAECMSEQDASIEFVFFGSSNRMESKVIPQAGYRFYGIEMSGMNGGLIAKASSALSILRAKKECRKIIKKERPDVCIGFGNYISVPLIQAAHAMHIPTMIHEQNSYAGKANRFLSRDADAIVGCYESNKEQFPQEKLRLLGNPEASVACHVQWDPASLREVGLDPNIPFVLFMMGSLGSSSVSKVIDEALPQMKGPYQILIAAGRSNDHTFSYPQDERVKIVPYVNGKEMLKGCALAVLRAGATTLAEIGAIGTPSILIPSPYVPNNHQYHNAMELVNADAAVIIEEKDLNADVLAEKVNDLMKKEEVRKQMRIHAEKMGKTDAAEKMSAWIKELAHAE